MKQKEKHFQCPFCFERISFIIDTSMDGEQTYVEDCEVCCNPIEVRFEIENNKIQVFEVQKSYG
jgi:hypothetical protein